MITVSQDVQSLIELNSKKEDDLSVLERIQTTLCGLTYQYGPTD